MTALGDLVGYGECVRAGEIRAINHDGDLLFNRVFDQRFVLVDILFETIFGKADRAGDMAYFVEYCRSDIEDQCGIALGELIKRSKRHAGNRAGSGRFDGSDFGDVIQIFAVCFFGIEGRDGFVRRSRTCG